MANTFFDTAKIIGQASAVAVTTDGSTNITKSGADLQGSLTNLGGNSDVDVSFEYRTVGSSTWNQTSPITKASTGSYTQTITGLSSATDYEFRAFAKGNDSGETATGSTLTFTTDTADPRIGVIDDFEDNDLSEYSNTQNAVITTNKTESGTYAVTSTTSGNALIESQSGLPRYPQAGDTFVAHSYYEDPADADQVAHRFAVDSVGWYDVYINETRNPSVDFRKNENSSTTSIATSNVSIPANEWIETKIEWGESGSFTVTLTDSNGNQITQLSGVDSTYTGGGIVHYISYGLDSSTLAYVDNWRITATTSGTGVIDDFEDNDIAEYTGDTGSATVQTGTVHDGTYALEVSTLSDGSGQTVASASGLPRYPQAGDTFQFWAQAGSSDTDFFHLYFGVQNATNPLGASYRTTFDLDGDLVKLVEITNGSATTLGSVSTSITAGSWYRVVVDWGSGGSIDITVYDDGGTNLGTASGVSTKYTSGGIGWEANSVLSSGGPFPAYFDTAEITSTTTDTTATGVVDDFEDGDIGEYSVDTGQASTVTTPVYEGTYALEMSQPANETSPGVRQIYSQPGDGLPRYPEAGDTIRLRMRIPSTTDGDWQFLWASQSANRNPYRYDLFLDPTDTRILLRADTSSGFTTFASDSTVSFTAGIWYELKIEWQAGGTITVTLNDDNGNQVSQISGTDNQLSSGGIGFGADQKGADMFVYADIVEII